jgi:hypothetical protein
VLSTSERSKCGGTAPHRLTYAHRPHVASPSERVHGEGGATCPSNPWTRFVVELDEPIGDRLLLDGGPGPQTNVGRSRSPWEFLC